MKKHLLLLALLLKASILFSQTPFTITGKTNFIANGKAILERNSASCFYPPGFKDDTVPVHNHAFLFTGSLKYPAFFRLTCIDENGKSAYSEPFFVDSGNQKITFDSTMAFHDLSANGQGISIQGSKANDEYVHNFLPLYQHVNEEISTYRSELTDNFSIRDKQVQRDSTAKTDARRVRFRRSSDSILYEYVNKYPRSPIISALLYDAAFRHNYSDYYYKAFDSITSYVPPNVSESLKAFLDIQKLKGVGQVFPLLDFMRANISEEGRQAKYTLVDFWFSGCGPCIANFNLLKETYKKFHDKGFNIVAISSDKKEALPKYEMIIKRFQYTWDQVLDLDGVKTKSINIRAFPTSFLLDSQGKIVQTFIEPVLLNDFLEKNL